LSLNRYQFRFNWRWSSSVVLSRLAGLLLVGMVACTTNPVVVPASESGWLWSKTFGGLGNDYANAIAVDGSGSVYVAGSSDQDFGWQNAGGNDAFVRKFDAQGSGLWTQTIATPGNDSISDLAVLGSQLFAVGSSDGPNGNGSIFSDAVLQTWDANGLVGPGLRFGTPKSDAAVAVAVGASSDDVFVVGWTDDALEGLDAKPKSRDAFVARFKLDAARNWVRVWTRALDCASDCEANGVALDPQGNLYVTGYSDGDIGSAKLNGTGSPDAFVAKFLADGTRDWVRLIGGAGSDFGNAVAANSSGVYLVGYSDGTVGDQIGSGLDDAFVARIGSDGQTIWVRLLGSTLADAAVDVSVNANTVQLVGYSDGVLKAGGSSAGGSSAGKADVFLAKFDPNGSRLSLLTLGGPGNDYGNAIANLESNGSVFVSGYTQETLPGNSSAGFIDAFVARYGPLEPK
jgi:Beta-propeller repeat